MRELQHVRTKNQTDARMNVKINSQTEKNL